MSVEINWSSLTTGPESHYLAETIRLFIHDRFQQIQLPRFIRSVNVHSFAFGDVAPDIVVKDICDPLPDFYQALDDDSEDSDDDDDNDHKQGQVDADASVKETVAGGDSSIVRKSATVEHEIQASSKDSARRLTASNAHTTYSTTAPNPAYHGANSKTANKIEDFQGTRNTRSGVSSTTTGSHRPRPLTAENMRHSFYHSNQSAIPGGTSNMTHFHLPYSAPFSGPTTPLAAMAGGHFGVWPDLNNAGHQENQHVRGGGASGTHRQSASISSITPPSSTDPGSRPPSQHRQNSIEEIESIASVGFDALPSPSEQNIKDHDPNDIQIVAHVKYSGNMKLNITAELSLDYPMSSFVGIPLQLQITGFSFDGIAIIAHVNRKVFTCFLSPEDAQTYLGTSHMNDDEKKDPSSNDAATGALLEEIRVESEIGQKDGGKQVLKNVGKVERFVLEQVRRIFEDEFVFPSFWTFLL